MNKKEALNQLKSLHYLLEHFQEIESRVGYVKALDYAILELERTAHEVPVQEQSQPKSTIDFGSGNFESIKLYNNKEDFEEYNTSKKSISIGLLLTPDVLRFSHINSIDEIFMIGFLKDK